jgi:hypothetical protein
VGKVLGKRLLLLNVKPLHTVFYVGIYLKYLQPLSKVSIWLKSSTKECENTDAVVEHALGWQLVNGERCVSSVVITGR